MHRPALLLPLLLLACAPAPARPSVPFTSPAAQSVTASAPPELRLQLSVDGLSVRVANLPASTLSLIGDQAIPNDGAHLTVLGSNLRPRSTEPNDWDTQCLAVTTRAATGWTCNLPDLAPGQSSTVVFVPADPARPASISTDGGLQGYATGGAPVSSFLPIQ